MAKVRAKVGKGAMEEAADRQPFEDCPPGMFVFEVKGAEVVESKKSKVDQVELVIKPVGLGKESNPLPAPYGQLWDYVQLDGESTEWKRAQFANAFPNEVKFDKKSGSIEFENDARKPGTIIGALCLGRVGREKGSEEYRPKIMGLYPYDASAASESKSTKAEANGSGDDHVYTKKELKAMDDEPFKALMKEWEIKSKGRDRKDLITEFLADQKEYLEENPV